MYIIILHNVQCIRVYTYCTSRHLTGDGISLDFNSFVSTSKKPRSFSVGQDND